MGSSRLNDQDQTRLCYYSYMANAGKKTKIYDAQIRQTLKSKLSSDGSKILEELAIARGQSRIDLVNVTANQVHGYEIKSDADTLRRLSNQVQFYDSVFTHTTLVVGIEHLTKAIYLIPDYWGVIVAKQIEDTLELIEIRKARGNKRVKYNSISDVMTKNDFVSVLNTYAPGGRYWSMSKPTLVHEARRLLTEERVINAFPERLLARA